MFKYVNFKFNINDVKSCNILATTFARESIGSNQPANRWHEYFIIIGKTMNKSRCTLQLGTIQVLRHQSGGWVGSENGNF